VIKVVTAVETQELLPVLDGRKAKEIEHATKQLVACAQKLVTALPHVKVISDVLDGDADQMIVEAAQDFKADLIVMGSHGRNGFKQFLMGSVSHAVLRSTPVPVRIVRQSGIASREHYNVLVAMNVWEHWEHTIDHLLQFTWSSNTRFECVMVLSNDHLYTCMDPIEVANEMLLKHAELEMKAVKILEAAVVRINRCTGENMASFKILEGQAPDQIIDEAGVWPADLIVMASHGRNFVERVFVGSVSEAVAGHARCAVEITRIQARKLAK
jgi:nucleotide-binding universal stress UspA family protein